MIDLTINQSNNRYYYSFSLSLKTPVGRLIDEGFYFTFTDKVVITQKALIKLFTLMNKFDRP